jgi:hypothetical protein
MGSVGLSTIEFLAEGELSRNRKYSRLVETESAEQVSIPTTSMECKELGVHHSIGARLEMPLSDTP